MQVAHSDVYLEVNIENKDKKIEKENDQYAKLRIGCAEIFEQCQFNLERWLIEYNKVFNHINKNVIDTVVSMSGFFSDSAKNEDIYLLESDIPLEYNVANFLYKYLYSTWDIVEEKHLIEN